MLCLTDLLETSFIQQYSGLSGINSLLSHFEKSIADTNFFSLSYISLLCAR